MKVLFYNCIYRPGHFYYDSKLITFLSKVSNALLVLQPDNWFKFDNSRIEYIDCEKIQSSKNRRKRISTWTTAIYNSWNAYKMCKMNHPDAVVVGEFELSTFWLSFFMLYSTCKRIIIVHHNNVDQIDTDSMKRLLFNFYKDKVYHCTLEPFIKDFVIKRFNLSEQRVFCWPHPMEPLEPVVIDNCIKLEKQYDVIGISQSNDESMIDFLVKRENKNGHFKNNGLRVLLKSKIQSFDNGALTVIKGWIDTESYKNYYNSTKSVIVAFPSTYRYRVSATLMEAFRDRIPVLGSDIELIRYYQKEYPSICRVYELDDIYRIIKDFTRDDSIREIDFDNFKTKHSDEYIIRRIEEDLFDLS